MADLIAHMESRLGKIQSGWTRDTRGVELGFQVAEFRGGGQLVGSTSFATIGLSEHKLRDPHTNEPLSVELVMTTHSAQAPARIPQAMQEVAKRILETHQPLLRGQAFKLPGAIAEGSNKSFVYAAVPGYFDEDFDIVTLPDDSEAAVIWLVPISEQEAGMLGKRGWPPFEQEWEDSDPDLLDLFRPNIEF